MHLFSFAELLKFLAAAGHNNYTKSGNIYLQQMHELEMTHPDVHHHFSNGLFVVRRSERLWAGIPSDQVIEQCVESRSNVIGHCHSLELVRFCKSSILDFRQSHPILTILRADDLKPLGRQPGSLHDHDMTRSMTLTDMT